MTDTITIPQVTDSGAVRGMMYALRGRYRFLDTMPIGRSVLGKEIFGLLLGGGNTGERVLFAAAFHGQEWLTALTVLRLCEDICEAMQKDGKLDDLDLRQALAGRSLILVPMVNPDGVDIALRGSGAAGPFAEQAAALGADQPGRWNEKRASTAPPPANGAAPAPKASRRPRPSPACAAASASVTWWPCTARGRKSTGGTAIAPRRRPA